VPLREAFEQVAAQAAELRAKLARTITEAMRHILETMVLSSSLFLLRSSIWGRFSRAAGEKKSRVWAGLN
jgi:hypothetical protein